MPNAQQQPPVVLTIAGFDPSAGAGIAADIKTFAAHGCYGVACITALTVQSTQGVRAVHAVDAQIIRDTLAELDSDFDIAAVKIGMLANAPVVNAIADFLERAKPRVSVVDPVLTSSSGATLLDDAGLRVFVDRLLPLAYVITPNSHEAALLTGLEVLDLPGAGRAAGRLHELGACNVVVTGGHLAEPCTVVSMHDRSRGPLRIPFERVESSATHGTGCAFSSSLAANLARNIALLPAVEAAQTYVSEALRNAPHLGYGNGPMQHLWGIGQESHRRL